jgi:hypothetical protein
LVEGVAIKLMPFDESCEADSWKVMDVTAPSTIDMPECMAFLAVVVKSDDI